MNMKKILIICLILCIVCTFSAVSAADVNADNDDALTMSKGDVVNANEESPLLASEDSDVLRAGGGTFTQLNDKINDPSLGDNPTIDLDKNYTYDDSSDRDFKGGIFFTKGMTIDGHGYTLDGNGLARILGIGIVNNNGQILHQGTTGPVVLKNIRFINAFSTEGDQNEGFGAVAFYGRENYQSSLLVENCTFLNNKAPTAGAFSIGFSYDNLVSITDCTFEGNAATGIGGGAIRLRNYVNNLQISDTVFKNNKANTTAGALHISSGGVGTLVDNCTFISNVAGMHGGAVQSEVDGVKFKDSRFFDNLAKSYGGAMYLKAVTANNIVDNCSFINNSAKGSSSGMGGAIYLTNLNGIINNSYFKNNTCDYTGNAYGGGAIVISGSNHIIDNCTFEYNYAMAHGGAISGKDSDNVLINKSYFFKNHAPNGGAMFFENINGYKIINSTFEKNYAQENSGTVSSGSKGGAINLNSWDRNLYISNCTFTANTAGRGGAIRCDDNSHYMKLYNSTFKDNYAKWEGGGFSHNYPSDNTHIENCTFINCTTETYQISHMDCMGGGLYLNFRDSKVVNVTIINCSSQIAGAIGMKVSERCTFKDIYIVNCSAGQNGGAVKVMDANSVFGNATIINTSSSYNYDNAGFGGGAIHWSGSTGSLSNVTIINSSAKNGRGGAILWSGSNGKLNDINITNTEITQNGGGAIFVSGATCSLTNVNITNSKASTYGGAIYWTGASGTLSDININKSKTDGSGGAVYVDANKVTITKSNFTNCSAGANGGAIYFASEKGSITFCNFINNTATVNGGALYIATSNQEIGNCTFEANNATGNGGAIYITKVSDIIIRDSTFKKSNAYNGGAIFYEGDSGASVYINNDTFTKNTASHNGGAVYYVVDNEGERIRVIYRDYNEFDKRADTTSKPGRWTVSMQTNDGSLLPNRIFESLFEDNMDYLLNASAGPMTGTIGGITNVSNPRDVNRNKYKIVINVTRINSQNQEVLVDQIILNTTDNYTQYYTDIYKKFVIPLRNNLTRDTEYNVTVGFEDSEYLYKETKLKFTTPNVESVGDFHLIQWMIGNATDGDTIVLLRPYEFMPVEDFPELTLPDDWYINITKPITINGNGFSISGEGYTRIFKITAVNVTLNNIQFINGNSSGIYNDAVAHDHAGTVKTCGDGINKGGAIYWSGVNGTVENSTFHDNYAEVGGGLYIAESALNNTITRCAFVENTADTFGGAIDCNAPKMNLTHTIFESNIADTGAALCREKTATGGFGINNTFIKNHALTNGSALAWMEARNIYIDNYTFIDNTAGISGGAIYVGKDSTNCTVAYSYFRGNNITSQDDGHGGAIEWYADTGRVINSTFINNNAPTGGAIYVGGASGHINITQSGFLRNHAIRVGGAIDLVASSVTVNNTYFRENTASEGGAIFVGGTGENNFINASYFTSNNATNGRGGAINWNASAGQIFNSNFTKNCAEQGGAIYIGGNSDNSQIVNVNFISNNATKNGGAIDWNATGGKLYNTTFTSNYAGEYGAALCRESGATGGGGKNNTFTSNHAGIAGAALGWINVEKITIVNYTFIDNTADHSGGAIYIGAGSNNCTIINSTFRGNNVTNVTGGHGGAVDVVADNATVINSTFTNNNAFYGGALFVGSASGHTIITNDTFTRNGADINGGAVYLLASDVNVTDSKFYSNRAINGSALYVGGIGENNTVNKSDFDGNIAIGYGAAIYWRAAAGTISFSNITRNTAMYGGGIYLNGISSNSNITNVTFKYNNATKNGGAIECNASNIGIYNLTFESNYAGEYGAALCREVGATSGHGTHNQFIKNHVDIGGAALAWMGVEHINITYYNFIDNTAGQRGGAIYVGEGSNFCIVNNSYFKGNNVTNDSFGFGGAIDINANNATVVNSIFINNHAYIAGAVAAGEKSGFTTINNVTFTNNGATTDGGAINLRASGVSINDTRFYKNSAGRRGGAIDVGGTGVNNKINNTVFEDNTAGNHGGAIDWIAQAGEILNSNFTRNSAEYGGGIYLNGVSSGSVISHVIFKENTATENGGAIDCNAREMNLTHTKFVSNYAKYGAALCREAGATGGFGKNNTFDKNHAYISGAALAWLDVSNIRINNYTFTNNTADFSGGAIFVNENSENCQVYNSTFKDNYVSNAISGRGGAIDWLGNNGTVKNTTFERCISVNGGAMYVGDQSDNMTVFNSTFTSCNSLTNGGSIVLYGDDVSITYSNFTSSVAMENGGAIAGFNSNNANISECKFKYNVAAGHIDPQKNYYGEGGAIYWKDSTNLRISNSTFTTNEGHLSGGSISADNCNDSIIYNITTLDETSFRNGGSVSWINSDNLTINKCYFNDSGANYYGGSIYLSNINATVKNTGINSSWASWGVGGGIYVNGNVTIDNVAFNDTHSYYDNATAIYFQSGISSVSNCNFTVAIKTLGIGKDANVTLTKNNITSEAPNKDLTYLIDNSTVAVNSVDYSVWNEGNLWLEKNNFDTVIFNNGTIWTKTTTKLLNNQTKNVTWNEYFTFWANITDDNLNTIISVRSLNTTNQVYQEVEHSFILPYNQITLQCSYQGSFQLKPFDKNLKQNDCQNGTLNVKMPVSVEITGAEIGNGKVEVTATLTPEAKSNYTIKDQSVFFDIDGSPYNLEGLKIVNIDEKFENPFTTWTKATVTFELDDLTSGTHTVTSRYNGDSVHLNFTKASPIAVNARDSWIKVVIASINYGQSTTALITTNSNGTVRLNFHGKNQIVVVPMTKGQDGNYTGSVPIVLDDYITTGEHDAGVVVETNEYFNANTNITSFEVYKLNTTVGATPISHIEVGDKQVIEVTVNENYALKNASGFVNITINGETYFKKLDANGKTTFNIYELPKGTYSNYVVGYEGDDCFNGNSTKISFTVGQNDDYNITVLVDNITYGQNATIYISLPTSVTQNLTVFVNNTKIENVPVSNGLAKVVVPNLKAGNYVVNVTYPGDDVFAAKEKNGTEFNVAASSDWTLNLTVVANQYGQDTTFTVNVPSNVATRLVNLTIDGKYHPITINGAGEGTLTLNNLSGGFHTVTANYTGDANYTSKVNSTNFYVEQAPSQVNLTQEGKTVVARVTDDAIGTVTFYVNGNNRTVDVGSDGFARWNDILEIGNNTVVAIYNGDKNFTVSQNSTKDFTIPKYDNSKVNVTATNETYGNASVITVKVPVAQTGYVNIVVIGTDINVTVPIDANGEARFNATGLDVGRYKINVTYLGDKLYNSKENFTYFNITKANLDATVYGLNVTVKDCPGFIVNVNDDFEGNVNITIGSVSYYDGAPKALITIGKLPADLYMANVTFYGSKNYNNKSVEVAFNVTRVTPAINVTIDDTTYPGKVIANINMSDYANGTINITVDGKFFNGTVKNGHVEIELTGLSAGSKVELINFTATDKYHFNVTTASKSVVEKAASQVNITQDDKSVIAQVTEKATGTVTFYVNGKANTTSIDANGFARWDDVLVVGNNSVVVVYNGDKNFTMSVNSTSDFTIPKYNNAEVNVSATTVTYGNASVITVKVPTAQTGYVRILVNGTDINVTAEINNGEATINVTGLDVGRYRVNVTYLENELYSAKENFTYFNITKANLTASVIAQNVTVDENISFIITVLNDFKGNVKIEVDGKTHDGDVETLIEMAKLLAGDKQATVTFYGDDNYNIKVLKPTFTVTAVEPTINVTIADSTYPENPKATVKVSGDANGTVEIKIGSKTFIRTITDGEVEIPLTGLDAGVKEAVINFYSNDNYNSDVNATYKFVINKAKSHIEINVTPESLQSGDDVLINISVSCTGEALVYLDGEKEPRLLQNNRIIINKNDLTVGEHNIVVYYPGDNNYESSSESYKFTVGKHESKVNVTVKDTPYKQIVEITVQTPIDQTEFVTITVNNQNYTKKLDNGVAKFNVTGLDVGKYDVNVTYHGDGNYNGTVNDTSFNVTSIELNPTVVGENVTENINTTFIIDVPDDYNGKVNITVDGINYNGDVYTVIRMAKLKSGDKVATVEFYGDNNYNNATLNVNFIVSNADVTTEIVVVDQGNGTLVVVVGDNATGNVTVKIGDNTYNATVVNGTAVVNVDNETPGLHDIEVIYSGDSIHNSSTVNATMTAPKYDSEMIVTVVDMGNGTVVVTVDVPLNATGNVTVNIGGIEHVKEVKDGQAIIVADNISGGNHTVAVGYLGDDNYVSNYTVSNVTVSSGMVDSEIVVIDMGNGTVVVVVGDNATGNVTVKIGDNVYNATVVNGTATITIGNETPGIHDIEVIYSGDSTHSNATVNSTISIPKYDSEMNVAVVDMGNGTVVVTVDVPLNATGNVTVNIGGIEYVKKVENGQVVIVADNISGGNHTVAVEYLGDDNYVSNYTVSNVTVSGGKVDSELVVVDMGNGTVVVVVGDNATGNVTVKVGDNVYNATVVNGTATITIGNETPGIHDIEVIYSGDDNHTNSTVNSTFDAPKYDSEMNVAVVDMGNGTVVVTVDVPLNATGNVTVSIGGVEYVKEVEDGQVVIVADNIGGGNHTVAVEYLGDDNYVSNYTVSNVTVSGGKVDSELVVVDMGNGTVVVVVGDNATGNVTVKVGDNVYNATVVNGTATITIGNETPGIHDIEVIYSGDDNHTNSTVNSTFDAPKYDSEINVTVSEVKEGETAIIKVEVPSDATGNVTVYIDGQNYTAEVKGGIATVEVPNITGGSKTVTVEYSGDGNYTGNYTIHTFEVEKKKETPSMIVENVNNTITVHVGDNATGNVTVKVGDDIYNATIINGTAVIPLDNVTPGEHEIEVIYSGDQNHNNITVNTTISVDKYQTPISINASDINVGDKAIITVEVPNTIKGTITIEIDGVEYTEKIINGVATFEIKNLIAGEKSVFAVYEGDSNYTRNFTTAQFNVSKVNSNLDVEIEDVNVGENVTITVRVPGDATGQVLIDIDGVGYYINVTDGIGTAQIPRLAEGNYDVNLTYTGDDKYLSSVNRTSVKVSKLESFVIPIAHNIRVGENEVIHILVPKDATGSVTLVIDDEEYTFNLNGALGATYMEGEKYSVAVSGGNGELVITGLSKGDYFVSVKYNGNERYLPSTNSTVFTVSKETTPMSVDDLGNGTVVVKLPEDATGNVTVTDGNNTYVVEVKNGEARVDLENTTPGKHDITVIYSGDGEHSSNATQASVDIPKYATPISVEAHDINVGDVEVVTVTLPEKATGTVTIEINGKEYTTSVSDGKAVFNVENLAFGNKTVAVKYSGDNNYLDNYTTGQFTVSKVPSTVTAKSKDIKVGKDEVIIATVPSDATGSVMVDIDGVGYYGTIVNGKAKIIIPELSAGKYKAEVTYEGDDKYLPSTTATSFTVTKSSAPISASSDDIDEGEDATVIVKLPKDATGTVTITVDGRTYTTEVNNGKAVFVVPGLTRGDYDIDASYSGDMKYEANDTITDIEVHFNETPDQPHGKDVGEGGIELSKYPTGNPIFALLLVILYIESLQFRRFRK